MLKLQFMNCKRFVVVSDVTAVVTGKKITVSQQLPHIDITYQYQEMVFPVLQAGNSYISHATSSLELEQGVNAG